MSDTPADTELAARRATREAARVDIANSRSWQLVSALRTEEFTPAQLGKADQILLDIEDAVDPSLKDGARADVVRWLSTGGRGWVRINDVTTSHWAEDVDALRDAPGLVGVMLAKAEDPESVAETAARLAGMPVVPLVESALGIEEAVRIAGAKGAVRLAFGSGDYRKDTGAENVAAAMAYPRARLVVASRIGNLPGPVDGPTPPGSHAQLREQGADGVAQGMTGKLCLDTSQPGVINEVFAPTPSDVDWAFGWLEEFEAGGRVLRDGSDKPRLGRAEKIVMRAKAFGLTPSTDTDA